MHSIHNNNNIRPASSITTPINTMENGVIPDKSAHYINPTSERKSRFNTVRHNENINHVSLQQPSTTTNTQSITTTCPIKNSTQTSNKNVTLSNVESIRPYEKILNRLETLENKREQTFRRETKKRNPIEYHSIFQTNKRQRRHQQQQQQQQRHKNITQSDGVMFCDFDTVMQHEEKSIYSNCFLDDSNEEEYLEIDYPSSGSEGAHYNQDDEENDSCYSDEDFCPTFHTDTTYQFDFETQFQNTTTHNDDYDRPDIESILYPHEILADNTNTLVYDHHRDVLDHRLIHQLYQEQTLDQVRPVDTISILEFPTLHIDTDTSLFDSEGTLEIILVDQNCHSDNNENPLHCSICFREDLLYFQSNTREEKNDTQYSKVLDLKTMAYHIQHDRIESNSSIAWCDETLLNENTKHVRRLCDRVFLNGLCRDIDHGICVACLRQIVLQFSNHPIQTNDAKDDNTDTLFIPCDFYTVFQNNNTSTSTTTISTTSNTHNNDHPCQEQGNPIFQYRIQDLDVFRHILETHEWRALCLYWITTYYEDTHTLIECPCDINNEDTEKSISQCRNIIGVPKHVISTTEPGRLILRDHTHSPCGGQLHFCFHCRNTLSIENESRVCESCWLTFLNPEHNDQTHTNNNIDIGGDGGVGDDVHLSVGYYLEHLPKTSQQIFESRNQSYQWNPFFQKIPDTTQERQLRSLGHNTCVVPRLEYCFYRNYALTLEIVTDQIVTLWESRDLNFHCAWCDIVMEKSVDCNALSHCHMERCNVCGISSWPYQNISNCHWRHNQVECTSTIAPHHLDNNNNNYMYHDDQHIGQNHNTIQSHEGDDDVWMWIKNYLYTYDIVSNRDDTIYDTHLDTDTLLRDVWSGRDGMLENDTMETLYATTTTTTTTTSTLSSSSSSSSICEYQRKYKHSKTRDDRQREQCENIHILHVSSRFNHLIDLLDKHERTFYRHFCDAVQFKVHNYCNNLDTVMDVKYLCNGVYAQGYCPRWDWDHYWKHTLRRWQNVEYLCVQGECYSHDKECRERSHQPGLQVMKALRRIFTFVSMFKSLPDRILTQLENNIERILSKHISRQEGKGGKDSTQLPSKTYSEDTSESTVNGVDKNIAKMAIILYYVNHQVSTYSFFTRDTISQ